MFATKMNIKRIVS